ncbi:MAG: hypothetical protein IPG91_10975 [Ideonella sp.]|nr:hypothetical protein [Ideonella sp.]
MLVRRLSGAKKAISPNIEPGLDEDADLDDLDPALGEVVQVIGPVALAEQDVAILALGVAHVGLEPDARALRRRSPHALGQAHHLHCAQDVDRQQQAVQEQHRDRWMQHAVEQETEVAPHGEPAQRDHGLDERAHDHQRGRDQHRDDGHDLQRRGERLVQARLGKRDDLVDRQGASQVGGRLQG